MFSSVISINCTFFSSHLPNYPSPYKNYIPYNNIATHWRSKHGPPLSAELLDLCHLHQWGPINIEKNTQPSQRFWKNLPWTVIQL